MDARSSGIQTAGMPIGRVALRVLAMLVAACVVAMAAAGVAKADTQVRGIDSQGTGGALAGDIEVAEAWGYEPGDTIYVRVKQNRKVIADNEAVKLTDGDATPYGVITLSIDGFHEKLLKDGGYTIEVKAGRTADSAVLYSGSLYGVYAQIDGKDVLIGMRTLASGESRGYSAPSTLYIGGATYNLQGAASGSDPSDAGALYYKYKKGGAATDVTATVKYVDYKTGDPVDTDEFTVGSEVVYRTIRGIDGDFEANGAHYRSVCGIADADGQVAFQNPGRTSITVNCFEVDLDESSSYTATIQMVQASKAGNIIASDQVDVKGPYTYTVPATIYKTETVDGERTMATYTLAEGQEQVLDLALLHEAGAKAQTFQVVYDRTANPNEVDVTFHLLDGTQEPGADDRLIDTDEQAVSAGDPTALPPATVSRDGVTYKISGTPSDYAYDYADRTTRAPSVNVYYVPEGYEADGDYTVTVNYVNYANNAVVGSQEFTSSPDDTGDVTIETPESFQTGSTEYIRLDGQDNLVHSYYSRNETYTVYYRDADDTLAPKSVSQVRVVYDRDATTTTRTTAATATGTAGNTSANTRLNAPGTYTTPGGDGGNGTLTNRRGQDTTTERITDDTTPLAQNGGSQATDDNGGSAGGIDGGLIAGIVAALAVALGLILFFVRRLNRDESAEA